MDDLLDKSLGKYEILEEVGRGGMATVYKALDTEEDKEVAIKVLSPYIAKDRRFKSRFEQETKVLLNLRHPHIVPVLDYGEIDDYAFIVMPFLTSGTLRERLVGGRLPLSAAADLLHQIADALDYAHTHGVVHRDIKPSNILINDDGKAMLTDFGFARVIDDSMSLTGSALIGTPSYMSPEQCRGEEATPLSDQYSLGIILYQMTTGKLPFEAETPLGVVIMHATAPLPPPREVYPELPRSIESVLLRSLDKDPANRYPTITAFDESFRKAIVAAKGSAAFDLLDDPTQIFSGFSYQMQQIRSKIRTRPWSRYIPNLLLVISVGLAIWGIFGLRSVVGGTEELDVRSAELLETIEALSTVNAPMPGTPTEPGQVETAVVGTLQALVTEEGEGSLEDEVVQTLIARASITPTPEPTASSTRTLRPGENTFTPAPTTTPGPSNSPSKTQTVTPTPTFTVTRTGTPTRTPTISPTPSPTVSPTGTPLTPTPTPSRTATNTITPIPPEKCKGPDHPVFPCTPTPQP